MGDGIVLRVVQELLLRDASFADVAHVAHVAADRRVLEEVREADLHPSRRAVGPADRDVGRLDATRARPQPAEDLADRLGVVGIDPREIEALELGRVAAEEMPGGRARVHHAAGVVDHQDRVRCVLHERAEPLLRLAFRAFGPFLFALTAATSAITNAVMAASITASP